MSRVLAKLGEPGLCLVVAGEDDAERFQAALRAQSVPAETWGIPGAIRVNITLVDVAGADELHSVAAGPAVSEVDWDDMVSWARGHMAPGSLFVLAGSLPPGAPETLAARLVAQGNSCGARVVVDTHGAPLKAALGAKPWAIKVNSSELAELVGLETAAHGPTLFHSARDLMNTWGLEWIGITFGEKGAAILKREMAVTAAPPPVRAVQTTGCGDGFLAGLLWAFAQGKPVREALTWANAVAGAIAEVPELGDITLDRVRELKEAVCVTELPLSKN